MLDLPALETALATGGAFLFGLVVGSFANVVIYRLPLEKSIVFPSSRCPGCGAAIRPSQNIPVISWLLLRGLCASCGQRISLRYPAVELLHGLGFALIVWTFGPQPFTLVLFLFFFALFVLAFIDWDHQILPDVITLPGILVGLGATQLRGALIDWREAGLAAGFGYLAFFLVAKGYARLRGIEGLGQGDWKLAAMMGSFLGGQRLMLTVLIASFTGMVYGLVQAFRQRSAQVHPAGIVLSPAGEPAAPALLSSEGSGQAGPIATAFSALTESTATPPAEPPPVSIGKYKLPFGTFLAASAIFVLFYGDPVLRWYASFFWL